MADEAPSEATRLLRALGGAERDALDKLAGILYRELRLLARRQLRREPGQQSLQTADLVHEAYLRLIDQRSVDWRSRAQFLGLAAQAMRRVLVDRARSRRAGKRGGDGLRISLGDIPEPGASEPAAALLALDGALSRLATLDPRQSRIVELRYFGGLTAEETGEVLGVSQATVERGLRLGKAWLRVELSRDGS